MTEYKMKQKIKEAVIHSPHKIESKDFKAIQFIRFLISGVFCAAVEIGILLFLVKKTGINYLISNFAAFIIANFINYLLSRYWIYGKGKHFVLIEFSSFIIISLVSIAINQFILYLTYDLLNLPLLISKLMAITIMVAWTFFSKKHIVFKH